MLASHAGRALEDLGTHHEELLLLLFLQLLELLLLLLLVPGAAIHCHSSTAAVTTWEGWSDHDSEALPSQ